MRAITRMLSVIFIFAIPWEGVEVSGLGTLAKPTGIAVAILWIGTILVTRQLRKPGLFQITAVVFVLWNAVSVFWSSDPLNSLDHTITWAQLLVFVFIVWDLYTTPTSITAALQAYVLGAFVAIGSALSNYSSGAAYYTHYDRFSSGDTNPDGFGFILALGIPVAWYLASLKSTTKLEILLRVMNYVYIPAALIGISLSGTRTALIATIPGMAFGLASSTRLRLWVQVTLAVLLASAIIALLPYVQTLTSFQRFSTTTSELTEGDLNNRTNNWREGLASFAEHPLIGVGSNMYRSVNSWSKVAHNSFISVLVELGLIGLILFGTMLLIAFSHTLRQSKWEKRLWLTLLMVWCIGASTLTWEYRKSTWLFLSLMVASAYITAGRDEPLLLAPPDSLATPRLPLSRPGHWLQGTERTPHLG
jgi:O-antigen ligase